MTRRTILFAAAGAGLAALAYGLYELDRMARVAAAYKAKTLCAEIFLAGRAADDVLAAEFDGISPAIDLAGARIDEENRRVSASLYGLGRARVSFRDGYGCTIEAGAPAPLPAHAPVEPADWETAPPVSGRAIERVHYAAIDAILNEAITDDRAMSRAFLVLVDGRIVAERYRPGFGEETPMLSWSMAKSVTASLVGAAALKGYLDIDDPAPVPEWEGDPARAAIAWRDLLGMESGLAFGEIYEDPRSDVSEMLFRAREAGAVAARQKLVHEPGAHFAYSSGTTNLAARALARLLEARGETIYGFARESLFGPLGAASFTLEPDSAGYPVGSSYVYATARDWARLGQLYLDDGVFNGQRLLPEGWSDFVSTPTKASDGQYGGHFWLNRDGEKRERFVPGLDETAYYMAGHEGQYVFILPERNAVIVRLGLTRGATPIDVVGPVIADLAAAIGEPRPSPASP